MTLRFKRNLPLVIALIAILTALVLVVGDQPIVSYTVNPQAVQAAGLSHSLGQLTSGFILVEP